MDLFRGPYNSIPILWVWRIYMIIVFSSLCLVRLTVFDQKELNFMREPYFWINSLNLLSCLITLVVLGLQSYILINKIEIANKTLYHAILPAVNAIVYGGYSYAFTLCRTQRARSSSPLSQSS